MVVNIHGDGSEKPLAVYLTVCLDSRDGAAQMQRRPEADGWRPRPDRPAPSDRAQPSGGSRPYSGGSKKLWQPSDRNGNRGTVTC